MTQDVRQNVLVGITTNPQSPNPLALRGYFTTATVGVPFDGFVLAVGGAGSNVYSVVSKPAWMTCTILSSGVHCTGTPTSGGSGAVSISVTDGSTTTALGTWYITVNPSIARVGGWQATSAFTPPPAYTGNVNYFYDTTKLLVSPTLPIVSASLSGSLPTGMSMPTSGASVGQISATNVTGTTQDVTVTLTDTAGAAWAIPLHLEVKPGLSATIVAGSAIVGIPYSGKLTVSGGSGDVSIIALPANPLPTGLVIHPKTGDISGIAASISPSTGPVPTHFQITDLDTGQQITTTLLSGGSKSFVVGPVTSPAPRGRFPIFDASGATTAIDLFSGWFGGGIDGDFVLDGTNTYGPTFTKVGSVYTQNRPIYPNSMTIGTGVTWDVGGNPFFIRTTLDVSAANIIIHNSGKDASGTTPGGAKGSTWFGDASAGGAPGISTPTGSHAGSSPSPATQNGGIGVAGAGGSSGTGSGGGLNAGGGAAQSSPYITDYFPIRTPFSPLQLFFGWFLGGLAGGGGGAGGGNGTVKGGDGGAGGGAPGILYGFAYTIVTSASTSAGTFRAKGGAGSNGGASGGAGRGAGGGGGGASGGIVWLVCVFRDGPQVTNLIDVSGGNAGAKGSTSLGGNAGVDGVAGSSGFAFAFVLSTQTAVMREITAIVSGTVGGVGTLTF